MSRALPQPYVLAEALVALLGPVCERVEIAGSIRRGKPDPKDIEIVCIPVQVQQLDLFHDPASTGRYDLNQWLSEQTDWELDRVLPKNGPRYKRLVHVRVRLCVDLFIARPTTWGIIFAIRTGPADFSKGLVTLAKQKGYQVDEGQLWRVHRDDTRTPVATPEEVDVFAVLGVPYLEPNARSLRALYQTQHKGKPSYGIKTD